MITLTRPEGSEPQDFHLTRRTAVSMFFAGYAVAAVAANARPVTTPAATYSYAETPRRLAVGGLAVRWLLFTSRVTKRVPS